MGYSSLSLSHKLPLWGGLLIVITALAVTGSNLLLTRESIKKNMLIRSELLGRSLVRTLYSALSEDDVWRAYEIINFPIQAERRQPGFQLEDFIVLDKANQVFVSTDAKRYPLQAELGKFGPEFGQLRSRLEQGDGHLVITESERILVAIPMVAEGVTLGTLILVHPADYYRASFERVFKRNAWTTLLILLVLLPPIWYWGRRMAAPLALLTERMGELGQKLPEAMPHRIYPHTDELGRLFHVYEQMRQELVEKEALERQMLKSDRLAALGRLTASMAHEINNPLGGLLTAVDTIKRHGQLDPVQARVVPLLERGLRQIQDIVAALLVEGKAKSRALTRQDVDDVHTLLSQEAGKRHVQWEWVNALDGNVRLPATLVRQILINLLLNAVQAAGEGGMVVTRIKPGTGGGMDIEVRNNGREIPPELMEHLFEPFTGNNEEGNGLGLWVTYQIVQQLQGRIEVASENGWTRFRTTLPPGDERWLSAESA